ncbi:tubulin [Ophiocordyceps sinensis CO18]|nr:tubulin [Ophiocordyceps sinensis CO18]
MVKATVPAHRMCCIKLEDGLGWEEICPFLRVSPPKETFPRGNEPEMFNDVVGAWVQTRVRRAALRLGLVLVLGASVMVFGVQRPSTVLAVVRRAAISVLHVRI